jgi:hypothetical protein
MAIIFKDNKKRSKVDHDHNYGGFWLGDAASNFEYEGRTAASSVVKALKLRNYQKAIANFVKILSQKDVPVVVKGTDSYTDGNQVVIAGNVNDKNFDITAGLALHEASHIKYTDFGVLKNYLRNDEWDTHKLRVKNMLNWIEDRRIDTIVFKSCPGYKAYYHKLYDHYFRCKEVTKMLKGKQFRTETYSNYEAHIINMMNTAFDKNALEVLPQVTALINVNKIARIKNTAEALAIAEEVVKLIEDHLESLAQQQQQDDDDQQQPQEEQPNAGQDENDEEQEGNDQEENDEEESGEEEDNNAGGGLGSNGSGEPTEEEDDTQELNAADMAKIRKKLQEQEQMINGDVEKKNAAKAIAKKLGEMQNSQVDYTSVGEGRYKNDALVYRLDKEQNKIASLYTYHIAKESIEKAYKNDTITRDQKREQLNELDSSVLSNLPVGLHGHWRRTMNTEMVAEGLQLGAILGRKLQTRRESRELVTNRLRTGKIDAKRIAHAGYGIENIFNQIHIDKYKNANIHLTIDASGSMGGPRWNNSIKLAMAMGKAVSMIEGLNLQVSMRETDHGDIPVVSIVYDSRANKLNHLKMALEMYQCNSMTPEGLCLEAMMKKNLVVPNNSECDSYLINICDGCPGAGSYGGYSAVLHTKKQVRKLNNDLGIKSIGYFFGEDNGYGWSRFQEMYGVATSKAIPDASNATQIADFMNKKLMSK